jgi:hypothetical protein
VTGLNGGDVAVTLKSPVPVGGQKKYPWALEVVWHTINLLGLLTLI